MNDNVDDMSDEIMGLQDQLDQSKNIIKQLKADLVAYALCRTENETFRRVNLELETRVAVLEAMQQRLQFENRILTEGNEDLQRQLEAEKVIERGLQKRITDMGKEANTLIKRLSMGFKLEPCFKQAAWLSLEDSSDSDEQPVV